MLEDIELTLSHVNLGGLTEFAMMALFGTAQAHRVTQGKGISIREIKDAEERVLYPGYFMTHLRVPAGHRLSRYRVWDHVTVGIDARSFGNRMVLETRYILGPRGEIAEDPKDWDYQRYPSMHGGTMFVIDGHTGEPRPAVPRADRVAPMPKLTAPPPSLARFAEVQGRGVVDLALGAGLASSEPIRYPLVAGRDLAPGRALMFASFAHLMDMVESTVLGDEAWPPFSRDLLDCASVLEREVYYFANCGAGDVILANVSGDLAPCAPDFHGDAKDVVSGGIYTLNVEIYQERTNTLLSAAKVTKLLAVPAARRSLLREAERLVLRHHKPAPKVEARPAPVVETGKRPESPAPVNETAPPARAAVAEVAELPQKLRHRLTQLLSEVSQYPLNGIDTREPLESYGIDSIMIAQLNHELEPVFPGLSKTLFFEHQTLDGVAGHLMEADSRSCATWVGLDRETPHDGAAPAPPRPSPEPRLLGARAEGAAGEPIAIIGVSGRYPKAATLAELWDNLRSGRDCIEEIPAERWPLDDFFVADKRAAMEQGKSYSKWGGFIEGFANFDSLFFNISPREARDMDPQERLFLETCWATFEDAGYSRAELQEVCQGRVGVFVGITKTGFDLYGPDLWRRGDLQNPQTSFSSVANRISYALNLQGPSMAIDTMCSASITAIHEACEHIHRGECDMAIAGGVNLYVHPSSYVRLCAQQMLSTHGRCMAFGENGDGFVPGEGAGAILLKRLSSALRDGDQIHALILGTSINHGGKTNGYTVPNPVAQARLVRQALTRAGVNARQMSYVEAHGTGTKLGDPIEARGLQQAFEEDTSDNQFCAIGSVKSNIGHLEAAAAIAGVTKVILQLQHRELVPSLHAEVLNPNIDFGKTPFVVQRELGEWRRPVAVHAGEPREYPRIAGVSSFGAGGSNGHVILSEFEGAPSPGGGAGGGPHAIVLSAKDRDRLKAVAGNLARHLHEHQDTLEHRLGDIAYTLQVGRDAMDERLAMVATSCAQAADKLRRFARGEENIEDLYCGQAKAKKGVLAVFGDDEDTADTLARWLLKRKYDRLLQLWVTGVDIDWSKLYEGTRPRRLSLPTYPFAGIPHWIATDGSRPPSPDRPHPLVHANTSTFAGQEFTTLLSGQEFFLSEHRVRGKRVLPGVAYLEMARAATSLSAPARITGLRNVMWSAVLSVERPTKVTIALSKDADRVKFAVRTGADVHGQGSVVLATAEDVGAPSSRAVDLRQIEARCPLTLRDDQVYAHFERIGLEYGAGFRALREIKCGERELLAAYRLPSTVADASSELVLHPSIMDAALQALIGFEMRTGAGSGQTRLPFSVHAVDLLKGLPPEGYVHATRVDTAAASDLMAYDIQVLDEGGAPCVTMQRFTLRPLVRDNPPARPERSEEPPRRDGLLLATPEWREQPPGSAAGGRDHSDALVLLVDGSPEIAAPLSARLGGDVQVLSLGEGAIEDTAVGIVKQAFARIKSALYPARSVRAIHVVISHQRDRRIRAPLASLLATVQQENTRVRGRVIAIPDEDRASVDALFAIVQRESASEPLSCEVVYERDGRRLVRQWYEAPAASDGRASIKAGGVYWITGGMGGLGRVIAQHLSSVADVSIVLSGRSPLADEDRRNLDSLAKPGRTLEYRPCDVGDRAQVKDTTEHLRRRYGKLDGVIHGAGVLRDALMVGKDVSDFDRVFAAKARGAEHIDWATRSMDLDFFLLCSSIAAVTGNVGQADYASANAYLDAFAETRDARVRAGERRGVTVSVNWPLWRDGGMRVDAETEARLARQTGMSPLATRDGLAAFDAILAGGVSGQVLVLSGDTDRIRRALSIGAASVAPAEEPKAAHGIGAPRSRVEGQIAELVAELLQIDVRELDADTHFSEYGVDSIHMMRMLNRLESQHEITLDPSAIASHPTIHQLARYLTEEAAGGGGAPRETRTPLVHPAPRAQPGTIAIIGHACRYPRSPDAETFWRNLAGGKNLITEVPRDRWNMDSVFSPDRGASGKSYSRHGGFLDDIAEFDAEFFGVSDADAIGMDPQHRVVLELARELFERAGYGREALDGSRTAVLLGAKDNNYVRNYYESFAPSSQKHMIVNSIANMAAARVSDFYNLKGAAKTVDTACSSSLVAVHDACQTIRAGEAEMAVAGGVFLLVDSFYHIGFSSAGVLSDDDRTYVFDEKAKGFVLGEGAGLLLLKDYEAALRDKDSILGIILASAVNNDGRTMGITVPSSEGQKAVIDEALKKSGVTPDCIGYFEAHGTGTLLGDPIEVKAATEVYREYTSKAQYCALGSVKSNMGHSLTAAGIASLSKVLLSLQHRQIPPTLHCSRPHPRFRFAESPFYPNTSLRAWEPIGERRVAAVTSLGFGGTNCHIIVAEP